MKTKIFWWLFIPGLLPFLLGFLGKYHWILDGFSHFRVYYFAYFLVLGIVAFFLKLKRESITILIFILLSGIGLLKFYIPVSEAASDESIKIVSVNLLSSNNDFEKTIALIETENPDIVVLQEVNQKWFNAISSIPSIFPYKLIDVREDNFGLVILSKLIFSENEKVVFSFSGVPSFSFNIDLEGEDVTIIATHPLPPVGTDYFNDRNMQFENINKYVRSIKGEVVVIGDLNTTSFSPNFSRITEETTLKDSRLGFGLQPSWNARLPVFSITIDHVLVSEGINVINRRIGQDIGSDHLPVIIEISLE